MSALHRLMQGKTTLLISHKLDLIAHADLILVIHEGGLCESGTHTELMAAGGVYAKLQTADGPRVVKHAGVAAPDATGSR